MWYLIDVDYGVIGTSRTKRGLRNRFEHCEIEYKKLGKPVYHLYTPATDDNETNGHEGALYSSAEQAEADGFAFAIQVYHHGGHDCEECQCIYNQYGYCTIPDELKVDEDGDCLNYRTQ